MKLLIHYAVGLGLFYGACQAFHLLFGFFVRVTG
jgi:hypothetical protein